MAKLNLPPASEFPQLEEIADPKRLTHVIGRHLGPRFASGELALSNCKLKRVYYKAGPDGHCRLHLKARVRRAGGPALGEQTFLAHLWPPARLVEQYARARGRSLVQPEYGEPLALVPEWNMILWAYPNDPRLVGLPVLSSASRVLARMQAAPERFGIPSGQKPVGVEAQLTKYVPGQRCGCLFRVKLDPEGEPRSEHAVYGKAYRGSTGRRAFEIQRKVWECGPRRRGELRLPEPHGYDPDLHILWQEALPGRPLAKTASDRGLPQLAERIGERLAAFHGAELELPVGHTLESQRVDLEGSVDEIASAFPDLAARCRALHDRLLAGLGGLGPEPRTPVHGSFKFSHIFVCDDDVAFIDFDGASLGDPGYDLGRFIAHLQEMKATHRLLPAVADEAARSFAAGYQRGSRHGISERRIRWYAASHILCSQIYKGVKRFDPGPAEALFPLAEELCAQD